MFKKALIRSFSRFAFPNRPLVYPGSRVLELTQPDLGNVISEELILSLNKSLTNYKENPIINAIIFSSYSPELFSIGIEKIEKSNSKNRIELVQMINSLSKKISNINKVTIAVYGGHVNATAYSTFATSKVLYSC